MMFQDDWRSAMFSKRRPDFTHVEYIVMKRNKMFLTKRSWILNGSWTLNEVQS